jgi:hypothetical protein
VCGCNKNDRWRKGAFARWGRRPILIFFPFKNKMASFDRFWQLHDQALAVLNRITGEEPLPSPSPDEIAGFEQLVDESNDCIANRQDDIDLEFLK